MRPLLLLLSALLIVSAAAQTAPPGPDPVVHPDRTVTFFYGPSSASAVAIEIDAYKEPFAMQRNEAGVWSVTTPPLPPEIYSYHFTVNGHRMFDLRNAHVTTSLAVIANTVEVPGTPPEPWELTAVPHGEIHAHLFTTKVVQGLPENQDIYFVYTPPGYDPHSATKYPVLYLLHGYSDNADGWTVVGRANLILDTLIAAGKAKPMIVVMPLGYGDMSFLRNGFRSWENPATVDNNTQLFAQMLLTEVMPQVEHSYNVSTRREDRAIAGLSMGGLESLTVGLTHTDKFAWVGGFSSAVQQFGAEGVPGMPQKVDNLKLLWIACGTEDGLIEPNRKLVAALKTRVPAVTAVETPGIHTWEVWRDDLVRFAPLLFR